MCNGDEPGLDNKSAAQVRANEATRDRRLRQWRGLRVIHIWGHDLQTEDAALASVRSALEREGIIVGKPNEPEPEPLPLLTAEEVRVAKRRASWERKLEREADRDRERPASVVEHFRLRAERESDLNLRSLLGEGREEYDQ